MASKANGNPNACPHVRADEFKGGATMVEKDLSIDSPSGAQHKICKGIYN